MRKTYFDSITSMNEVAESRKQDKELTVTSMSVHCNCNKYCAGYKIFDSEWFDVLEELIFCPDCFHTFTPTKFYLKYPNWKEPILYGFHGVDYDNLNGYLEQINWSKIDNNIVEIVVPHAIRHIYTIIMFEENQLDIIKADNLKGVLISKLNVNDIVDELLNFCCFLPNVEKYLPYIDSQAEMVKLICENYVFGLIKKLGEK